MSGPLSPTLLGLAASFRDEATHAEPYNPGAAYAWRRAADAIEQAVREAADELLTLEQAAELSGYSAERLRHLIADGAIPQAGRKGAPRIRRGDVPRKAGKARAGATAGPQGYDPTADALSLLGRANGSQGGQQRGRRRSAHG